MLFFFFKRNFLVSKYDFEENYKQLCIRQTLKDPLYFSVIAVAVLDIFSKIRPEFFYFRVLGKFLGIPSVGGGNKNKNKIQKFPESE